MVCTDILETESFIRFLRLFFNSYYGWMALKICDGVINITIIYIIIILAKRSDTVVQNKINEIFIRIFSSLLIASFPSTKVIVLVPLFLLPKIGFTFFQNLLPLRSDILRSA